MSMQEKTDRKPSVMEVRDQIREKYEANLKFIKQLLKEKGELRESVVDRLGDIERQMIQLEEENRQLRLQLHDFQSKMADLAQRQEEESRQLQGVLLQDESLINVQVASVQLHSSLEFMEVITLIGEIVINLVGSENFALCLRRQGDQAYVPIHTWGASGRAMEPFRMGEGPIGLQLQTGQSFYWRRARGGAENTPMALIPLSLMGETVGALVIFDLLPQKAEFSPTDDDLLECIRNQAGAALMAGNLFQHAGRPALEFPTDLFDHG